MIETAAVAQAPAVCSQPALQELAVAVARMDELSKASALDVKTFNAADAAFHRMTIAIAGNRFLLQAFDSLHVHVQIARHYQERSLEDARCANEEHQRILAAFAAGDGALAAQEAGIHIDGVLARLQSNLGSQDQALLRPETR